jgi:hypothetical protein
VGTTGVLGLAADCKGTGATALDHWEAKGREDVGGDSGARAADSDAAAE